MSRRVGDRERRDMAVALQCGRRRNRRSTHHQAVVASDLGQNGRVIDILRVAEPQRRRAAIRQGNR